MLPSFCRPLFPCFQVPNRNEYVGCLPNFHAEDDYQQEDFDVYVQFHMILEISKNDWTIIIIVIIVGYINNLWILSLITLEINHVNDLPLFIGLLPISSSNQSWFGPVKYKMLLISSGSITYPLVISHVELWKITIF